MSHSGTEHAGETIRIRLRVVNSSAAGRRFRIEPWGDEYPMPAGAVFEVAADGPEGDTLEIEFDEAGVVAYGWPGSVVRISHDGRTLGPEAPRSPVPAVPRGVTVREFVDGILKG